MLSNLNPRNVLVKFLGWKVQEEGQEGKRQAAEDLKEPAMRGRGKPASFEAPAGQRIDEQWVV